MLPVFGVASVLYRDFFSFGTLTYKQYQCLVDARYGFIRLEAHPTERKNEQPCKIHTQGQKTAASLTRHEFLILNDENAFIITDHGLNALKVGGLMN